MADQPLKVSAVLAAMADGIGDLTFASAEWVEAASAVLTETVNSLHGGTEPLTANDNDKRVRE